MFKFFSSKAKVSMSYWVACHNVAQITFRLRYELIIFYSDIEYTFFFVGES